MFEGLLEYLDFLMAVGPTKVDGWGGVDSGEARAACKRSEKDRVCS